MYSPDHFSKKQQKKKVLASRHPMLTGPDVTCYSFIHSAISCLDVCVGTMPRWCRRPWWAHGWKAAEEKITCHSESVRAAPEATTPPSMPSSPCSCSPWMFFFCLAVCTFCPFPVHLPCCPHTEWATVSAEFLGSTLGYQGHPLAGLHNQCTLHFQSYCIEGVLVHKMGRCSSGPWNWRRNQE